MRVPGGFKNLGGMMKQAQKQMRDLQHKMREVEDDLRDRVVEGSAGGGMVRVMFNGLQEPLDVKIDEQVLQEESPEFLQEMILAAMRQGLKKAKELEETEREKVSGSLNIPGLDGLI